MQALAAEKQASVSYRLFIAAKKHAVKMRSATARKHAAAADRLSCRLSRKANRLWRLANASLRNVIAASLHAKQLATSVACLYNTTFSGKKARLL